MPNHLASETSPYLLQHKDNPVEWYPWGDEAFARARAENKPIFLSIGYSACHWCHVMAHESFEDQETARILNENFVSIKVDREERPDVDSIYMNAVQAISGSGGWPMSVFLMPDGRPFFGGTYFPNTTRGGLPSFSQLLDQVSRAYREQHDALERDAGNLTKAISRVIALEGENSAKVGEETLQIAFQDIATRYDRVNGGFGSQPKFPPSMTLEFLLRLHHRFGWNQALEMVTFTLDRMARGGIYDQLGGGFHRYSTDARWLVPHFEKMLYDNALLLRVYLNAYQVTGDMLYRRVVEETIEYIRREMTDPEGGFYGTQDADSEGHEGKFFVWNEEQLNEALDQKVDVKAVLDYWGVSSGPNFEGHNILWVLEPPAEVAERHHLSLDALEHQVVTARDALYRLRQDRIPPGKDTKILVAWNGLMISALAQAARVLDRTDILGMAVQASDFVLGKLYANGRLRRSFKDGQARFDGYLEDYSFLAEGLLELYQSTFDMKWFRAALALTETLVEQFWDDGVGFYDTSRDHEKLVIRPQEIADNALPSGTSSAVAVLLRISILADRPEWRERARRILDRLASAVQEYPTAFSYLACQLDFSLSQPDEIALVGDRDSAPMKAMLDTVFKKYRPNQVIAFSSGGDGAEEWIPLLRERESIGGQPTAYVCHNFVCELPVTTAEALAVQLDRPLPGSP